ncbi:hypothetical protein Poli38472_009676 [Pythium oligandrum]|uniref:Glutathione transferase n=1 Tax=Pythium oligandrum TaxID=41045 RepID=A0A8K1CGP3_PYTOL|nr:hypothetical protein Poli38472_009676 [Pythium oligandrum]|eukprot:TMW62183.1 hypothetical protein Poli38472_009676 [Pythium oligandrum]
MSVVPTLKLVYLNAAARAECIRLALYMGNIPFQDVRLSRQEFDELKPTLPYNQLPVLEVNGQVIAQSQAILRYAGRLSGLYPVNDPLAALQVDELLGSIDELGAKVGTTLREQDLEKRKTLREKLGAETIPRYFDLINKRLAKMKQKAVFQSDQVFIHELMIDQFVSWMRDYTPEHIPNTVCDGFDAVDELVVRVRGHPKWQEYYANPRNVTPKLKLTYVDDSGRVEATRLALHIGGVEFEDVRMEDAALSCAQLPVLHVNDEVYHQSSQILRYAGTLSALYSTVNFEQALRVDEVLCLLDDLHYAILSTRAFKGDELNAAREALKTTTIPEMLGSLDKRVAGWDGSYAVGNELTVADLDIFASLSDMQGDRLLEEPTALEYEHLKRVFDQVASLPQVLEYARKTQ